MTQQDTKKKNDEYINTMYDASLKQQQETLKQNYDKNQAAIDEQKRQTQQQTDANLTRTYVEAQKAGKNAAEYENALGLSSGAAAQSRLSRGNQLQADLTALRGVQAEQDYQLERQRELLSREYASAIAQAQAENDLAKAEALYQEAKEQDARQREQDAMLAQLMADSGDYTRFQQLYGLTDAEVAALKAMSQGYSGSSGGGSGGGGGDTGGSSDTQKTKGEEGSGEYKLEDFAREYAQKDVYSDPSAYTLDLGDAVRRRSFGMNLSDMYQPAQAPTGTGSGSGTSSGAGGKSLSQRVLEQQISDELAFVSAIRQLFGK